MATTNVKKIAAEVMARDIDPEEFKRDEQRRNIATGKSMTVEEYAQFLAKY